MHSGLRNFPFALVPGACTAYAGFVGALAAALVVSGVSAIPVRAQTPAAPERLWPAEAPGSKGTADADIPTVQAYLPTPEKANGAAVVICPGGAYAGLAISYEGQTPAEWMKSLGVAAFVLKYRLGPKYNHPVELGDAQRALRWVRANARRLGVDTSRVGILGFSAGGHLASSAATHFDAGRAAAADSVDRHPCRPAFQILIYPVITMDASFSHLQSRTNLLGSNPSQALVDSLSSEKQVTARTPPAFLVHGRNDNVVVFKNSQVYHDSLLKKGIPVELRAYDNAPHGFGLADGKAGAPNLPQVATWPGFAAQFLEARGFMAKSTGIQAAARGRQALETPRRSGWAEWLHARARNLMGRGDAAYRR
jgi:acetyl esterase/lipase